MNRKWLPLLLVIGLAIALFFVRRYNNTPGTTATKTAPASAGKKTSQTGTAASGKKAAEPSVTTINRDRGFDRRISYIEYTRHARCRMGCRHITQQEVEGIMQDGNINYSKSDVKARPCPEYALEGNTSDGQRVRIVFAQCDQKTKVVTVIDLGEEWSCDCPGDDKKSRN